MCEIVDQLYPNIRKPKEIVYVTFDLDDIEAIKQIDYFEDAEFYQPEDGPIDPGEVGCIETAEFIIKFIGHISDD